MEQEGAGYQQAQAAAPSVLLARFAECLPTGLVIYEQGKAHHILLSNQAFCVLTGWSAQEAQERFAGSFTAMVFAEDRDGWERFAAGAEQGSARSAATYRLQCADGLHWILEKSRPLQETYNCSASLSVLMDISIQKEGEERLRQNLEQYRSLLEHSSDFLWEWEFTSDQLTGSQGWKRQFGYPLFSPAVTKMLSSPCHIHPEDREKLAQFLQKLRCGTAFAQMQLRIATFQKQYLWCRLRAATQYDAAGVPVRAVGIATDISEERRLLERAERDAMTGLLNKAATENQVTAVLRRAGHTSCALMILDLDHFKLVNDRYGHLCGDAVLADTARAVQRMFRASDIIGRIGGDEFLMFLPGIGQAAALKKAKRLLKELSKIHLDEAAQHMTCSIGIAFYPRDAKNFADLYCLADQALYQVKKKGRADVALYSAQREAQETLEAEFLQSSRNCVAVRQEHLYIDGSRLLQESFCALRGNLEELPKTIPRVLQFLGNWLYASRVTLLLCEQTAQRYRPAFFWDSDLAAGPGAFPQDDVFWSPQEHPGKTMLYTCGDTAHLKTSLGQVLKKTGVVSFAECPLQQQHLHLGLLLLENRRQGAVWSCEQLEVMQQIADLLALFLLNDRKMQCMR